MARSLTFLRLAESNSPFWALLISIFLGAQHLPNNSMHSSSLLFIFYKELAFSIFHRKWGGLCFPSFSYCLLKFCSVECNQHLSSFSGLPPSHQYREHNTEWEITLFITDDKKIIQPSTSELQKGSGVVRNGLSLETTRLWKRPELGGSGGGQRGKAPTEKFHLHPGYSSKERPWLHPYCLSGLGSRSGLCIIPYLHASTFSRRGPGLSSGLSGEEITVSSVEPNLW